MTEPPTPTTILLVRHAEVDNPDRLLYGRLPRFALSPQGKQQAERLATALAQHPVTAIYTGPLLRARRTAAAIARHHPTAPVHRDARLHEVRSAWQGTPFADFAAGFNTYDNRRAPDDESIADIQTRMTRFIAAIRRRHSGETVVAVSHGDPITILRLALRGEESTVAALRGPDYAALASVTEITYPPGAEKPAIRVLDVPAKQPASNS